MNAKEAQAFENLLAIVQHYQRMTTPTSTRRKQTKIIYLNFKKERP